MKRKILFVILLLAAVLVLGACFFPTPPKPGVPSLNAKHLTLEMDGGSLEVRTGEHGETRLIRRDGAGNLLYEREEESLPIFKGAKVCGLAADSGFLLSVSYYGSKDSLLVSLDADCGFLFSIKPRRAVDALYGLANGGFAARTIEYHEDCSCGDVLWLQFYTQAGKPAGEGQAAPQVAGRYGKLLLADSGYIYRYAYGDDDKEVDVLFDLAGNRLE